MALVAQNCWHRHHAGLAQLTQNVIVPPEPGDSSLVAGNCRHRHHASSPTLFQPQVALTDYIFVSRTAPDIENNYDPDFTQLRGDMGALIDIVNMGMAPDYNYQSEGTDITGYSVINPRNFRWTDREHPSIIIRSENTWNTDGTLKASVWWFSDDAGVSYAKIGTVNFFYDNDSGALIRYSWEA